MKRLLNIVAVVLFTMAGYFIGLLISGLVLHGLQSMGGIILARDILGLKLMPLVVGIASGYISYQIIFKR